MSAPETFISRCLHGDAQPADIDDVVDQWHAGKQGQGVTLRELLGLDGAEYAAWIRNGRVIHSIVEAHRTGACRLPLRAFPEIEQLRHVVADVTHTAEYVGQGDDGKPRYDTSRAKPVLTFRGTAKLHGSNAGIAFDLMRGTRYAQSKERILSVEQDNFGFAAWMSSAAAAEEVDNLRHAILVAAADIAEQPIIACYAFGEWCGPLVNGKTGIGQLPMRWVLFNGLVMLEDGSEKWLSAGDIAAAWRAANHADAARIQFITDFPQYFVDIDFNSPEAILDELERLTLEVEAECPVAKALGGSGIGEGIVWTCNDPVYGRHTFKTKGTKHKGTKNSRLVQIAPEIIAGIEAFADAVVTDSRLEQGFELIRADHGKVTEDHIGRFLMWVGQDVLKEEKDTLQASGLERKEVMRAVNHRAKAWLMPRLARV